MKLKMSDFESINAVNTKGVNAQEEVKTEAKNTELPSIAAAPKAESKPKEKLAFFDEDPASAPLADVLNDDLFIRIVTSIPNSNWQDKTDWLTIPKEFTTGLDPDYVSELEIKLNLFRDQNLLAQEREVKNECIDDFFAHMRSYKECEELLTHLESVPQTHAVKKEIQGLKETMRSDKIHMSVAKNIITGERERREAYLRDALTDNPSEDNPYAHYFDPLKKRIAKDTEIANKNRKKNNRVLSLTPILTLGAIFSVGYIAVKLFMI